MAWVYEFHDTQILLPSHNCVNIDVNLGSIYVDRESFKSNNFVEISSSFFGYSYFEAEFAAMAIRFLSFPFN